MSTEIDVVRWTTHTAETSERGGFVAYGDYLTLFRRFNEQAERITALEASNAHLRDALRAQSDKIQKMALQAISDESNREGLLDRVAELERDAGQEMARLDFVLANDVFTICCNRKGSLFRYQAMTQDEDKSYRVLHDEHQFYGSVRESIDAAIAAQFESQGAGQ
jgi:hypothetical protein